MRNVAKARCLEVGGFRWAASGSVAVAIGLMVSLPTGGVAEAKSGGLAGLSGAPGNIHCGQCHRTEEGSFEGLAPPEVAPEIFLELVEGTMAPGEPSRLRLTVLSRAVEGIGSRGLGFDVTTRDRTEQQEAGALSSIEGQESRIYLKELTHTRPHSFDDDRSAAIEFEFTPDAEGPGAFYVAVVDSDLNGRPGPEDLVQVAGFCYTAGDGPEVELEGCNATLEIPEEPEEPEEPQPEEPQAEEPVTGESSSGEDDAGGGLLGGGDDDNGAESNEDAGNGEATSSCSVPGQPGGSSDQVPTGGLLLLGLGCIWSHRRQRRNR